MAGTQRGVSLVLHSVPDRVGDLDTHWRACRRYTVHRRGSRGPQIETRIAASKRMGTRVVALLSGQDLARHEGTMATLTIEVKDSDVDQLEQIADAEFRSPEQQAGAFVHAVLQQRAKAATDKPTAVTRRGPRAAVAA